MEVVIMVIVLLNSTSARIMGQPYPTVAACEKAKAEVTAQVVAAGISDFGITCTSTIKVGKPA